MRLHAKRFILGIALLGITAWISGQRVQASGWDGYDTTAICTGEVYEERSDIPAEEGLSYYRKALEEGTPRERILEGFSRSEEFQEIMRGFGL